MNREFLIYPEAKEKLHSNKELKKRLKKVNLNELNIHSFSSNDSVIQEFTDIISSVPEAKDYYKLRLMKLIDSDNDRYWITNNINDFKLKSVPEQKDICRYDDLRLFNGEFLGGVLELDEIWTPEKFGFKSPFELISYVSIYNINRYLEESKKHRGCDFSFIVKDKVGNELETEFKGNMHFDFLIEQKNITKRPTINPLGENTLIRPIFRDETNYISGSHSVETNVMFTFLKYAKQIGAKISIFEDKEKQKELIEWIEKLKQNPRGGGGCTEHLMGGVDRMAISCGKSDFECYELMKVDKDNNIINKIHTINYIPCYAMEGGYVYLIGENDELIITDYHDSMQETKKIRNRKVVFYPENIDDIIKAMLYQSANLLGRTSVGSIVKVLEFGFDEYNSRKKI